MYIGAEHPALRPALRDPLMTAKRMPRPTRLSQGGCGLSTPHHGIYEAAWGHKTLRARTTPPLSQLRSLMYRMVYRHSTQLNTILPLAACASACLYPQ